MKRPLFPGALCAGALLILLPRSDEIVVTGARSETISFAAAEEAVEARAFELLNRDRAQAGLPSLVRDRNLDRIAGAHSRDMRDHGFVAHDSPRTGAPGDRLRAAGYRTVAHAENVARDSGIEEAEAALLDSPGHRRNILTREMTRVGIGVATLGEDEGSVVYLTQLFARPMPVIEPGAARRDLLASIQASRERRDASRLRVQAGLDELAAAWAARSGAKPKRIVREAASRGLAPRGSWAAVLTVGELEELSVPDETYSASYRRIGLGVHQDPDRPAPNITVVILLAD